MTGQLEERLRDAFEARVAHPPALRAPADTALGRANVARRRRRVAVVAAVAVVVALVTGGVGTARLADRSASTDPAAPPSAAPPGTGPATVDLVVDGAIRTADGRTLALPAGMPAEPAYGWWVPAGWVLAGQHGSGPAEAAVLGPDGEPIADTPADGLVLRPDGRSSAWVQSGGNVILAAAVGAGLLGEPPLNGGATEGWWRDSVVVSRPADAGGGNVQLGLWTPGPSTPVRWSASILEPTVLGPSPDGRYLVAAASRSAGMDPEAGWNTKCLVELDPAAQLAVHARVCPSLMTAVPSESPDHRWLVTPQDAGNPARTYDLAGLFAHPNGAAVTGPACGLAGDGHPVWETDATYLVVAGGTLNRCRVGSPMIAQLTNDDPRLKGARTVVPLSPTTG